jgi:allantoicase
MDGWESKRHNQSFDWCIIRMGFTGSIQGFTVDTCNFTGNFAQHARVEALWFFIFDLFFF